MGGLGSGKSGWLPTIEDGLKLDLRSLRRQGLFRPIGALCSTNLRWSYTATGEEVANAQLTYWQDRVRIGFV